MVLQVYKFHCLYLSSKALVFIACSDRFRHHFKELSSSTLNALTPHHHVGRLMFLGSTFPEFEQTSLCISAYLSDQGTFVLLILRFEHSKNRTLHSWNNLMQSKTEESTFSQALSFQNHSLG